MSGFRLTCPSCGNSQLVSATVANAAKVRCPECKVAFAPGSAREKSPDSGAIRVARPAAPPPPPPPRKPARREEDEDTEARSQPRPRRKNSSQGLSKGIVIGLIAAGMAMAGVVTGVVLLVVNLQKKDESTSVVFTPPTQALGTGQSEIQNPPVLPPGPATGTPAPASSDSLSDEVLTRVKQATVYISVLYPDRTKGSGTGFYCLGENLVLTNAHVLGMLAPKNPPPSTIELVMNSGTQGSWNTTATVLALDRENDLAVLAAKPSPGQPWPKPLPLLGANSLKETHQVFVIGFPYGEELGRSVTVSKASVSSLRRNSFGSLDRVQLSGQMDPGNSGGPVTDSRGNVVGVAVSRLSGSQLCFAIPAETVQGMINGRLVSWQVLEEGQRAGKLFIKARARCINPLLRMKEVGVDWWIGEPGETRYSGNAPARPVAEDGPRTFAPARIAANGESAESAIDLPDYPTDGKTVWCQFHYTDGSGQKHFTEAQMCELRPPPRKEPANLTLKIREERNRLELKSNTALQITAGKDHINLERSIDSHFWEDVRLLGSPGQLVTYYSVADKYEVEVRKDYEALPMSSRMKEVLRNISTLGLVRVGDGSGARTRRFVDLRRVPRDYQILMEAMSDQLHNSLDWASLTVPSLVIQPGTRWKMTKTLPVDLPDDRDLVARAAVTCTYLGTRPYGKHRHAVVDLQVEIGTTGNPNTELTGGGLGTALIDLDTGRVVRIDLNARAAIILRGSTRLVVAGSMWTSLKRKEALPLPQNTSLVTLRDYKELPIPVAIRPTGSTTPPTGSTGSTTPTTPPGPTTNARLRRRFEGQDRLTGAMAFSANGRYFASCGNLCCIWETATGNLVRRITSKDGTFAATAVRLSADGELILVSGTDRAGNNPAVYRVSDGKQICRFTGHSQTVRAIWFASDGSIAASSSNDETACIWNARTGQVLHTLRPNMGTLNGVVLSGDQKYWVVSGRATGIFEVATGKKLFDIKPATGILAPFPDGKHFLAGGSDGTLRKYAFETGKLVDAWSGHRSWIEHVSISADGVRFLSTSQDGTTRLWDVNKAQPIAILETPGGFGGTTLGADGRTFANAKDGPAHGLWDLP